PDDAGRPKTLSQGAPAGAELYASPGGHRPGRTVQAAGRIGQPACGRVTARGHHIVKESPRCREPCKRFLGRRLPGSGVISGGKSLIDGPPDTGQRRRIENTHRSVGSENADRDRKSVV